MRQAHDVSSTQQGHEAINRLWQHVKQQTQDGVRGRLVWEPIDLPYRHQLRKLFHGVILEAFAWNVRVWSDEAGRAMRYTPAVWKLHLAGLFCPGVESTEDLSDEEFARFVLACEAHGAVEHGLVFPDKEATHAAPHGI